MGGDCSPPFLRFRPPSTSLRWRDGIAVAGTAAACLPSLVAVGGPLGADACATNRATRRNRQQAAGAASATDNRVAHAVGVNAYISAGNRTERAGQELDNDAEQQIESVPGNQGKDSGKEFRGLLVKGTAYGLLVAAGTAPLYFVATQTEAISVVARYAEGFKDIEQILKLAGRLRTPPE